MTYDYIKINEDGFVDEVEDQETIAKLDAIFDVEEDDNDNYELIDEDELELVEVR